MSTPSKVTFAKPHKLRAPAKVFRLIKRKVKGRIISPYWQCRVRIARGKYKQITTGTPHLQAAREFALLWIKEDFPKLCPLLGITPLEKPTLPPPSLSQLGQPGSRDRTAP